MSDTFNDREKAFENKFKLDEEQRFKVNARAVRSFGLWVAGLLGLAGSAADDYAQSVVDADFQSPGIHDFIGKVKEDLAAKGHEHSVHQLEHHFNTHREDAVKSLNTPA